MENKEEAENNQQVTQEQETPENKEVVVVE